MLYKKITTLPNNLDWLIQDQEQRIYGK